MYCTVKVHTKFTCSYESHIMSCENFTEMACISSTRNCEIKEGNRAQSEPWRNDVTSSQR